MKTSRAQPGERAQGVRVFLRIKHPSMDPREMSRTLAMDPEESIAAGPEESRTGVRRLYSESYWIASVPTPSIADLVKRFREMGGGAEQARLVSKQDAIAMVGASEFDIRILPVLKRLEAHQEFFDRINRDGGSVTLIVDRGDDPQPIAVKRMLPKLAQLGLSLELD